MDTRVLLGIAGVAAVVAVVAAVAGPHLTGQNGGAGPRPAVADASDEHVAFVLGRRQSRFELGDQSPRRIVVKKLAGDTTIDLSKARRDARAEVQVLFGDVELIVPRGAGVRIFGRQDGLGGWRAPGYAAAGNYLTNGDWGRAGVVSLDLNVQRGLGTVTVRTVEAPVASAGR